jgi:translation initiation factor 1
MAADDTKPFHNPFDALASLTGIKPEPAGGSTPLGPPVPDVPAASSARASSAKPAPKPPSGPGPARAVVRMERSGRGGKEVTVVEHLGLPPAQREVWLKQLKSGLGCGGTVEGDALVLQGDQRKRLPALLTARGVKRVTLG